MTELHSRDTDMGAIACGPWSSLHDTKAPTALWAATCLSGRSSGPERTGRQSVLLGVLSGGKTSCVYSVGRKTDSFENWPHWIEGDTSNSDSHSGAIMPPADRSRATTNPTYFVDDSCGVLR